MVCKQCGAYCEQNRSFCPICRAPLPIEENAQAASAGAAPAGPAPAGPAPAGSGQAPGQPSWGFVQSPSWPKPTFDLNAVEELPLPDQPPANARGEEPQGAEGGEPVYPTQYQDTQYQDTQHQEPQYQDTQYQEPQYQDTQYRDTQYQDTQYQEPQYQDAQYQDTQYQGAAYPNAPYQNAYRGAAYTAPQGQASPYSGVQPLSSVGSSPYQTGSFGRMPRREELDGAGEEEFSASRGRRDTRRGGAGYSRRGSSGAKRSRGGGAFSGANRANLIFFGAVGVLVILLFVFAGIFLKKNYGGVGGFFRSVFGGTPILKDAEMELGIDEKTGAEVYNITVHARNGNTVTLSVGGTTISGEITNGNVKHVQFPKVLLQPVEPVDGPTAEIAPEVTVTTKEGEVFPVDIPLTAVDVPALDIQLTSPQGDTVEVSRSKIVISGTVSPIESTSVTVQGQPVVIQADGAFAGEYDLGEPGTHTLQIEARSNGYQIFRKAVQVNYTKAEGYLDGVDKASLRALDSGVATVKGTISAGATMAISSSDSRVTLGEPNVNAQTGIFSFTATMSETGAYPVEVSVTQDGNTTASTVIVEFAPEYAAYTKAVHALDYDRLIKEPNHAGKYKCVGKVVEVIQEEPFYIAKLQTSQGDLIFEYHNVKATVSTSDGMTYNVFGDYTGFDEETGLPHIYSWYITKE